MITTAAFYKEAFTATTPTDVDALADAVLGRSSTTGLVAAQDLSIVAVFAGGALLSRARLAAPTLSRLLSPWVRPIANAVADLADDPNLMLIVNNPLPLPAGKALRVQAVVTGSTAVLALVWLADRVEPIPPGPVYTLRFQQPAAGAIVPTADIWSPVPVSFDEQLPAGRFAVIGFEYVVTDLTADAAAARLVIPGSLFRPGVLATNGANALTTRTADALYDGSLGVLGYIDNFAMPSLEVLQVTTPVSPFEGYLRLVQVADAMGRPVGCNC